MIYTVRFAHLEKRPHLAIGDSIVRGDYIATAGNSGASLGRHLHIDCVEGLRPVVWTLSNMENCIIKSATRQLNYFIDNELFGDNDFEITTPYGDYQYQRKLKKVHLAYDIVPENRESWEIYWNRTPQGTVIYNNYHSGYGNCLMISFEA